MSVNTSHFLGLLSTDHVGGPSIQNAGQIPQALAGM